MRRGLVAQNVATGASTVALWPRVTDARSQYRARPRSRRSWTAPRARARDADEAVFTGLRATEIRGLTWADVDFRPRGWCGCASGRTRRAASARQADPPGATCPWRRPWSTALKEWSWPAPPDRTGVPRPRRRPLRHNSLRDQLGRIHRFRHFYASWLIDQGFGPKRVQALMGHSSIKMTFDVYGHLWPQEDDHDRFAAAELALLG